MRIFLLGKAGNITGWLDGCAEGLRLAGHTVRLGNTRVAGLGRGFDRLMRSDRLGRPLAAALRRDIRRFSPELILGISAYDIPPDLLEAVAALPGRPPMVGWSGDVFSQAHRRAAALFDFVAYTDSGLVELHRSLGFASTPAYVPHAANPVLLREENPSVGLERRMVFVANPTPYRQMLLEKLHTPVRIFGPGWRRFRSADHKITARRVSLRELGRIYARHFASLNARNETKVLGGLNQRNFDPCLFGTAVVTDAQPDVERCFEPGREVLVYRSAEELDEVCAGLVRNPAEAARIGELGRRRVLAEHSYGHRLRAIAQLIGAGLPSGSLPTQAWPR